MGGLGSVRPQSTVLAKENTYLCPSRVVLTSCGPRSHNLFERNNPFRRYWSEWTTLLDPFTSIWIQRHPVVARLPD